MKEIYEVKKINKKSPIVVEVPGSKSITNRALMLTALSNGTCTLKGVLFSDDSRAFLSCLLSLGFDVQIDEEQKSVTIHGLGGKIPNRNAEINVRSAGTAARFLTVMLAFAGGNYTCNSSEQMKKRPMNPLLSVLKEAGVKITCLEEEGHFPFKIESEAVSSSEIEIETNLSSQFSSALLMAGVLLPNGLRVKMLGQRSTSSYIKITLSMMKQFGITVVQEGSVCTVPNDDSYHIPEYNIEPDLSGACYFYGMAALLGTSVTVKQVHQNSMQGDIKFLSVLKELGCRVDEEEQGVCVTGLTDGNYNGITIDMKDFSDQTMTLAALAPFANTPTLIKNIGHIRYQETDRIQAILNELTRLGITCKEDKAEEGILILPGEINPATVETYEDHRMAMAFTLVGLRVEGIKIANPKCCGKTFENYFEIIDEITRA